MAPILLSVNMFWFEFIPPKSDECVIQNYLVVWLLVFFELGHRNIGLYSSF